MDMKNEIKTLSALEDYVDAEFEKIAQEKNWQTRYKAYQSLEACVKNIYKRDIEFLDEAEKKAEADNTLPSWQMFLEAPMDACTSIVALSLTMSMMMPDQIAQREEERDERSQALFDKIDQAKTKAKMFGLIPIQEKFDRLQRQFQQHVNQCPRIKKNPEIKFEINALFSNLDKAKKDLNATGDLVQFRTTVNDLFKAFPEDAKFEINGTATWFQRHVIRPFEQFKYDVGVLFEDILNKISEHHKDSPRFFKKPVDNALETYQQDLEDLAIYEPPKPTK